jgi:hypothetical protein
MKRDNWTNEEVINILEGFKFTGKNGDPLVYMDWNVALDSAITQFYDFKRSTDEYAAMAYDPTTKEIVVVGPPLQR